MDIENTDVVENEILETEETTGEDLFAEEAPSEEPSAYEPNYSFKVKDEEMEFGEAIRASITNKETEDYVRDLYTRAHGLDHVKESLESTKTNLDEYKQGFSNLYNGFDRIRQQRDSGNLRGLLETLGVTEEQMLKHAVEVAKEMNLPEEQRVSIQEQRQGDKRIQQLEKQLGDYQSQMEEIKKREEMSEVNSLMESPEYKDVFDLVKSAGRNPMDEIKSLGQAIHKETKQYPTVKQVMDHFVTNARMYMPKQPEPVVQPEVQTIDRKATLPKVRTSNSPAGDIGPASIDDLRNIRNAMFK